MTGIEYWTYICLDLMQTDKLPFHTAINLINSLDDFENSNIAIEELCDHVMEKLNKCH